MNPRVAELQRGAVDTALRSARNMQRNGTVAYSSDGFLDDFETFLSAGWETIELVADVEGYSLETNNSEGINE